jgi:hypothetical protein
LVAGNPIPKEEEVNIMAKTFDSRLEEAKQFVKDGKIKEAISTLKKADKMNSKKSIEFKVPEWILELEEPKEKKDKLDANKDNENEEKDPDENIDFKVLVPFTMNNMTQRSGTIIKMPRRRKLNFSSHIKALEDIEEEAKS